MIHNVGYWSSNTKFNGYLIILKQSMAEIIMVKNISSNGQNAMDSSDVFNQQSKSTIVITGKTIIITIIITNFAVIIDLHRFDYTQHKNFPHFD